MASLLRYGASRYFSTVPPLKFKPASAVSGHEGGYKLWRNISLFVCFPAIAVVTAYCYIDEMNESHDPPPFVAYDYLRIRTKRFPWGDGTKSLFHNPHRNALPDGYEEH